MAKDLKQAQAEYERKQAAKVSIEKPKHVERYDEDQKRQLERSRRNHHSAK
jgi:hypothetical protein